MFLKWKYVPVNYPNELFTGLHFSTSLKHIAEMFCTPLNMLKYRWPQILATCVLNIVIKLNCIIGTLNVVRQYCQFSPCRHNLNVWQNKTTSSQGICCTLYCIISITLRIVAKHFDLIWRNNTIYVYSVKGNTTSDIFVCSDLISIPTHAVSSSCKRCKKRWRILIEANCLTVMWKN